MNWDAIGAVGNVVGGVGMIVTLIYLAAQIRQNSSQLAAQSRFNFYQTRVSLGLVALSDRELLSASIKAQTGQEFDPIETRKLRVIGGLLFVAWEYEVGEVQRGRLGLDEFNVVEKRRIVQVPFMQETWQQFRQTAPPSFVEFMEQHVVGDSASSTP
jgi:hypothetical protein